MAKKISEFTEAASAPAGSKYLFELADGTYRSIDEANVTGGGDMSQSVYDPTSVAGDAFDMTNMVGGGFTHSATETVLGTSDLVFTERADHAGTPGAGAGRLWVRNDTPNVLVFTDDAGTDFVLGSAGSLLPVVDTTGIVKGSADDTKVLRFEVDGFTTATTRVATWPDQDGTIIYADTVDTLTNKQIDDFSNLVHANNVHAKIRNESGGLLTAGTPVYATGYSVGQDALTVDAADADDPAKMPAIGIIEEDVANNANGELTVFGQVTNVNTAAWAAGDELWVDTTAGQLVNARPVTKTGDVQKMAFVTRSHASLGRMYVIGAGRSNDIPNTQSDETFMVVDDGDATKQFEIEMSTASTSTLTTLNTTSTVNRSISLPDAATTLLGRTGTPVDNQIAVFTSANEVEGDANLVWNGTQLGIGTPSPSAKLEVLGSGANTVFNTGAAADGRIEFDYNSVRQGWINIDSGVISLVGDGTANTEIALSPDGAEAMRLDANGNVGIGTALPDEKLDISTGNFRLGGDIVFEERADHAATPTAGLGQLWVRSDTPNVLVFTDDAGTDTVLGAAGGGINNVVEDTTPQLGGQLDVNGFGLGDGTLELLTFVETGSAVNHVQITNAATAGTPTIAAVGDDANVTLSLLAKGTGNVKIGNYTFDADQTVGAGQDNYVLTYDNGTGLISLEVAGAGGGDVTKVGTPVNNQIGVWTGDGTIEGDANLTYDSATTTLQAKSYLDVWNGDAVTWGADNGATTRTTSTTKTARNACVHYNTAEEDFAMFSATSASGLNQLLIGGIGATYNQATEINFYCAANSTTVGTTQRMQLTNTELSTQMSIHNFAETATPLVTFGNGTDATSNYPFRMSYDTNGETLFRFDNDTAGTASRVGFMASTGSGSIQMAAQSASYTTSSEYIADAGILKADAALSAGLVICTDAVGAGIKYFVNGDASETIEHYSTGTYHIKTGDLQFTEKADHSETPAAGMGYLWVKSDTPSSLIFTADDGTDYDLTAAAGGGDVTKVGTPVDNQLGVWTGDGTIEGDANLTWDGADLDVKGQIDVWNGASIITIGGDSGSDTLRTTATTKVYRMGFAHYSNAEEPCQIMSGSCTAGTSALNLGGGTSAMNACETVSIYTAANTTTTTGTERFKVDASGNVFIYSGYVRIADANSHLGVSNKQGDDTYNIIAGINQNAESSIRCDNATAGTAAVAGLVATADGGGGTFKMHSSSFTTSGAAIADGAKLEANSSASGGLTIVAAATGADVVVYAGGAADGDKVATFADGGAVTFTGNIEKSVTAGITASTTQTQGQGPLTTDINEVSTVANASDTVTLPTAVAGMKVTVINNGANTLQIFPASGDDLGAGLNTATTIATTEFAEFTAYDATNWTGVKLTKI